MSVVAGLVAGTIIAGVRGLTDTSGQKLDIIIEGIGILKEYCEKDLQLSKEEKKEWETRAVSWLRAILDPEAGLDIKLAGWDSSIKPNLRSETSITGEGKSGEWLSLVSDWISSISPPPRAEVRSNRPRYENAPNEDQYYYENAPKDSKDDTSSLIGDKIKTLASGFDTLALKAEGLLGKLTLVTEAQADELTDADKGKTASDEGKTTDTAVLDELKLLKESFAAQIASGRAALSEARDQVIFAREAVTTLQTRVATLSVVVTNLKLPKSEEPRINEYVEYQLDSTYRRI